MSKKAKKMTPKQILAAKEVKVEVGDVLDPQQIGIPDNKSYGPLPVLTVTKAKDGILIEGTIQCGECQTVVEIHSGDWFQKRRCEKCQKKAQRHAANPPMTEEEKAEVVAERLAKKLASEDEKAKQKAIKAEEKAVLTRQKAEEKAEKIRQDAEAKAQKLFQKANVAV